MPPEKNDCNFAILDERGRPYPLPAGCEGNYFKLLTAIYRNHPLPEPLNFELSLFHNGERVLDKALIAVARAYMAAIDRAVKEASAEVTAKYTPNWLK